MFAMAAVAMTPPLSGWTVTIDSTSTGDTVYVTWGTNTVDIINPYHGNGITVTANNGNVTINSTTSTTNIPYVLSGASNAGSLTLTTAKKLKLFLDNLSLTSDTTLPAIYLTEKKDATVTLRGTSTLADNANNAQKGVLQSKGTLVFTGSGTLNVSGYAKHGIASTKESITVQSGTINVLTAASDGIHGVGVNITGGTVNVTNPNGDGIDGDEGAIEISGGEITVNCSANDVKGISCDSTLTISGGTVNVTVSGDQSKGFKTKENMFVTGGEITVNANGSVVLEEIGSGYDPSYCTGVKTSGDFTISNGTLTIVCPSSNAGGHGISTDGDCNVMGGTLHITATGSCVKYADTTGVYDVYASTCIKSDAGLNTGGGTTGAKEGPGQQSSIGTILVSSPLIKCSGTYTYFTSPTISGGTNWHGLYSGATVSTSGSGTSTTPKPTSITSSGDTSAVACGSLTWYGTTYTASGTYTHVLHDICGADSTVTLHLTVYNGTHNVETATACGSYVWHDTEYFESGTYTYEYTNANGCESVDTLKLTIHYGTHNVITDTAYKFYEWHGETYNESGTYTFDYENNEGCESVDTLHLIVIHCNSITPPYTENFDSYTESTTAATGVEPDCWELVQEDVDMPDAKRPQLYYKSAFANSGNYSLLLNYRGIYAMPAMAEDVTIQDVKLEMYLRQANAAYLLEVGVWDDATNTFMPVVLFNNATTGVEQVTCDFSSYTGNGRRIAFRNVLVSGKTWNYSYNYLDDITIDNAVAAKGTASDESVTDAMAADRDMVDVTVYPNPTKDVVNVECTMNNVQLEGIEVIDVYGKVVRNVGLPQCDSPTDGISRINVSDLAAGMYFVRVTTDKGAVTKPFVKR